MQSCTECQANIRKQAAQISLKKIVCRARALFFKFAALHTGSIIRSSNICAISWVTW